MAQLIVRNLPEEIVRKLKVRAARHGRSAEAEHRLILVGALSPKESRHSLKDALLAMPEVGEDIDFARERAKPRRVAI